jgi:hypothetical protein
MPTDSQFLDGTSDIQRLAILRAAEAQGTYISPLTDACFKDATEDVQRLEILRAIEGISGGGGGSGTVTSVTGGTGLNGGTITTTGTLSVKYGTTAGTAAEGNDARLSDARIPTGSAGGDLAGTYPNPTVDGLQGQPVSNAIPANGQVLQYNGTAWVPGTIPTGGSGGGGVIYYLNFNTAADAPLTNIPQTPNTSKELGLVGETTATSYLSPILSTASYNFLASFVTDLNVPSATAIPAGIWDFNIFVESTTTNSANQIRFKVEILKYDGVNTPTLLATSNDVYIYDPAEINQEVASVVMPQTTILATDRILVYLYGRANQNNNRLTFHFGGNYPSHTHSTMPSVTGTGVAKVVNGVFQSPASTIVNADVSATAAIEVSKLSQATNRILGRTTAGTGSVEELSVAGNLTLASGTLTSASSDVQIFATTGSTTWTKPANAKSVNIQLFGAGGGGGGGFKNVAGGNRSGGGGGGGGGYLNTTVPASLLSPSAIDITIGAGGAGGAGSTTNGVLGVAGVQGGSTIFGTGISGAITYIALGGAGGAGGSISSAAGGVGSLNANNGGGGASGSGTNGAPSSVTSSHMMGGAGGGGGGGLNAASAIGLGNSGGRSNVLNLGGGASQGGNGIDNVNAVNGLFAVGSGGGAGNASLTNGMNGGNGGFPASGGGGGGAAESGNGGNGGTGGAGMAIITTYF